MNDQKLRYEFLSHTADIRLKASGETLPDLFQACLKGMNELLLPGFCDSKKYVDVSESIGIESGNSTLLLIDFLSEVLTSSHIHQAIFCTLSIESMSDHILHGLLSGHAIDRFKTDIKAVTYHEADIYLNEDGDFETLIIFDI